MQHHYQQLQAEARAAGRSALPPVAERSTDRRTRLTEFVSALSLQVFTDAASSLGYRSIPRLNEPLPSGSKSAALFVLSLVACFWKRLGDNGLEIDLNEAAVNAGGSFYLLQFDSSRAAEAFAAYTRFRDLMGTPDFTDFLEKLEAVVNWYVFLPPTEKSEVLPAFGALLQRCLQTVEWR
jgi:hypothetical protein